MISGALGSAVFVVHQTPPRFRLEPMAVSVPALRRILHSFLDAGYRFVGLDEVGRGGGRGGEGGAGFLPRGAIALTADDGYVSQAKELGPMLRELGIPWTVFVLAGALGRWNAWDVPAVSPRERHLTADEVRRLAGKGVMIGSHGATHRRMSTLTQEALLEELVASRETLQHLSGQRVEAVAYPWGEADGRVAAAARRAGYRLGFRLDARRCRGLPADPELHIPRTTLYAPDAFLPLLRATSLGAPRILRRARDGLTRAGRGMVRVWVRLLGPARA